MADASADATVQCPGCAESNDADAGRCTACGRTFTIEMGAHAGHAGHAGVIDAPTAVSSRRSVEEEPTLIRESGAADAPTAISSAPTDAHEEPTAIGRPPVLPRDDPDPSSVVGSGARCGGCGVRASSAWRFCKRCGARLDAGVSGAPRHRLLEIRIDGEPTGRRHEIRDGALVVGRSMGDVVLQDDVALSASHASFEIDDGRVHVRDLDSTNGTFFEARAFEPLRPGSVILIGPHRLLYQRREGATSGERDLALIGPGGRVKSLYPLDRDPRVIGCGEVDLCLPRVSGCARRHAEITWTGDGHSIRGLSPRARTWVSLQASRVLRDGDLVRLGDRTILEYRRSAEGA